MPRNDHPIRTLATIGGDRLQLVLRGVDEGLDDLSDRECNELAEQGLIEWRGDRPQWSPNGWDVAQVVRSNA